MDVRLLVVVYLMISVLSVIGTPYRSRSRNKNSSPTYDQKQTGEYNIQLHLKDFEVVALLSDAAFGEFGDYDYNYDYSELTVKPGGSHSTTTTSKPTPKPETVLPPATTPVVDITSKVPTTSNLYTLDQQQSSSTTKKPTDQPILSSTTQKQQTIATPEKGSIIYVNLTNAPSTSSTIRLENEIETNVTKDELNNQSTTIRSDFVVKPVENLTIIDTKEPAAAQEENLPLVVHRKCASGFTRDKLGRCRRVRRPPPQFSFGISRLATLANKLRQGSTNDSQTTNIESELAEE